MGRDLLYKPPVPIPASEDSEVKPGARAKSGALPGQRGRDLGGVGSPVLAPVAPKPQPLPAEGSSTVRSPAYKAAYFNQDSSGVHDVNLRQRNMQALRGAEGATDLRQVVLPPSSIATPEPGQLRGASDLMGLDGSFELTLEALLGRQSAWAKGQGVTLEMLKARLAQLEQMVEARKRALGRLLAKGGKPVAASVTLEKAAAVRGGAAAESDDLVQAGAELIRKVANQAEGMHRRLAKALGIKR